MRRTLSILFTLAALLFLVQTARYWNTLLDDAYISLRYSENLVEGRGLVFNVGETVEGYTNFSWVMLGAAYLAAGFDAMEALQGTSRLAALLLLWSLYRLQQTTRNRDSSSFEIPALLWILPLEAFAYWTSTGMETMLFAALFVTGLDLTLREAQDGRLRATALVWTLLAMTRPEGVLACALGLAVSFCVERVRRGIWPWRRILISGSTFALLFGTYFLWRWNYYGELFPNTFYAKVTGGREQWINGFINLRQWATAHPLFAAGLLTAPILFLRGRLHWKERPELIAVAATAVVWIGYVVSVGGDFMPFLRFFLPVASLCALVLSAVLSTGLDKFLATHGADASDADHADAGRSSALPASWILVGALVIHVGASLPTDEPYRAFVAHRTTVVGEVVGEYFRERYPEETWIAVNTAGSLPYASKLPTIDMLGLTDKAIARHPVYIISPLWAGHRRGWGEYVLSRGPRAIVWYNSAGLAEPHYLGDRQLADLPLFRFFYQMHRVELPGRREPGDVLERFLGTPFGETTGRSLELGTNFEVRETAGVSYTAARAAPIVLHFFELRRDREDLWDASLASDGDLGLFLDRIVERWAAEAAQRPAPDPELVRQVEGLCDFALTRIEAGARAEAKQILSRAAAQNVAARSPRVYQYIANLAVLEQDLFLAVHAQQEALRLDPQNALYRRNLENLLQVPYKEFKATQ